VLQSLIPGPAAFGGAKTPLLLAVVLHYALSHSLGAMVMAALVAGIVQDSFSLTPMGYSALGFTVLGIVVNRLRDSLVRENLITAAVVGAACAAAMTLAMYGMLAVGADFVSQPFGRIALKTAGTAGLAVPATPAVWWIARRADRLVGLEERDGS
jgi:rod shape-determining protein MreD